MTPHASDSGNYFEEPSGSPRVSVARAARTATGTSAAFPTEDVNEVEAELVVHAAPTGTSPTLTAALETRTAGGDWYTVASFPQVAAAGTTGRVFDGLGAECRWAWTLGGTTPSFDFSIAARAERD